MLIQLQKFNAIRHFLLGCGVWEVQALGQFRQTALVQLGVLDNSANIVFVTSVSVGEGRNVSRGSQLLFFVLTIFGSLLFLVPAKMIYICVGFLYASLTHHNSH